MFYVQGYSKLMALEYKDPKAEFGFVPWRDKIYSSNVKTCKKKYNKLRWQTFAQLLRSMFTKQKEKMSH